MPRKVRASPAAEEIATKLARAILQIEMKKRGVSYRDLTEKLNLARIEDNEANVRNKIGRGTFSASFFLTCLLLMRAKQIDLEWSFEEMEKLLKVGDES
jgi:hypothetical protein